MPRKNAKKTNSSESDGQEFFAALAQIEKEKGISAEVMMKKITQALATAYKRDHEGAGDNIEIKAGLPSSIDGVDAQGKEVESESWYTVDGMKVEKPRGGLFIHTVRYTDGTVRTDKVAVE